MGRAGAKCHRSPRLKDHIRPSPRLIVGQPPAVSTADRILREQDVARMDEEVLAFAGLEIKRSTQRDDKLPDGRGVPGEGAAGSRFLKRDGRRRHSAAQRVPPLAVNIDDALLEIRIPVVSGPKPYASVHVLAPVVVAAFGSRRSGAALAERGSIDRNGTTVTSSRMA
jgi:hypothetical protein